MTSGAAAVCSYSWHEYAVLVEWGAAIAVEPAVPRPVRIRFEALSQSNESVMSR